MIKSTRGTSIDTVVWDRKAVKPLSIETNKPSRKALTPKNREFNTVVSDIETARVKQHILYYAIEQTKINITLNVI